MLFPTHLPYPITDLSPWKTRFLHVIWDLRHAENLPTLLMTDSSRALPWKDNARYKLMLSQILSYHVLDMIPSDTWFLSDSNRGFRYVPQFMFQKGCFVIQAASLDHRMEWEKELIYVYNLVMKLWSAEELISGLQLQPDIQSRFLTTVKPLVEFSLEQNMARLGMRSCMLLIYPRSIR
ncbi:hypothetical protein BDP27DRAFT_720554 [Rhodocollybia butyracea]|uniref:Uncharacterized protein n=1 Tax=Rhodocollybia butyracea TaxID=206335 RepID=A0A9P5PUS5_9AGAR|nr:hypothetical protein BDP27DRAFT_720554 [Rhodocollybia butyracea]